MTFDETIKTQDFLFYFIFFLNFFEVFSFNTISFVQGRRWWRL